MVLEVKNFGDVEKRKQLVKTPKVVLLLAIGAVLEIILLGAAFSIFWLTSLPVSIVLFFVVALAIPYLVAYGIVIPLFIAEIIIQKPLRILRASARQADTREAQSFKDRHRGKFRQNEYAGNFENGSFGGEEVAAPPESYNTPLGIAKFVKGLTGNEEILIFELGEILSGRRAETVPHYSA